MPKSRNRPHPAKALIVGNGETITEVAAAVGVNAHTLGRILNGHVEPWPGVVEKLSAYLGKPASELFHDRAGDLDLLVSDSRAAQGLPPTITDKDVLDQIAVLIAAAEKSGSREAA